MAYQPKSYKKFVATAATATLVASAIAPVASAATFTDVNSNYTEAVNYLVANKIAQGTTETTFGTTASITRGDAAVMIANALGLDTSKAPESAFTDLNNRVKASVNALSAAGIINGKSATQFAPADNITRAEMAKVIALAYKLDRTGTTNEFTDVNSTFDEYVDALVKYEITLGKTESLFGATQNVTRGEFALFVFRAENLTPATPEVVSVSAINGTQLVVKFSQNVDEDNLGTYTLSDGKTATAELLSDGKSVQLTLDTAYDNTKSHTVAVTVEGAVIDGTENTFPIFTSILNVEDKVAAGVAEVKAVTKGATADEATITFTEPVKEGLIKLNGTTYNITAYLGGKESVDTVKLTGLALDSSKELTLEVINLKDAAGNVIALTSKQFKVTKDAVAPVVSSLEAYGDYKVLVTFDKKIDATTVAAGDVKVVDELLNQVTVDTFEALVGDSTGTKFVVTLDKTAPEVSGLYTNKNSRSLTLVFADKSVDDVLGNQLAAVTKSVTLTKDSSAPSVTGITYKKNSDKEVETITVTFDENIADVVDATFLSKFTVVNASGVQKNSILSGASVTVTGKTAVIDITDAPLTGKHSFQIAAGAAQDLALSANNSKAYSATVDFGAAPTASGTFELAANAINDSTENVVEITFPKAVKGGAVAGSATDVNNYSVNGKVLPVGTTILLDEDQLVATITFAEGFTANDVDAIFTINNIQLLTGEVIKPVTTTVEIFDNVAPVLEAIRIIDADTIELTYSEALAAITNGDALDELEVYEGTSKKTLTSVTANNVTGFSKKITVDLNAALDLTKEISVKTTVDADDADVAISDLNNGNVQKAGVTVK